MIPCRVLVRGPYSDYQDSGTNRIAKVREVGDIIRFPMEYANRLKNNDMVEFVTPDGESLEIGTIDLDEGEPEIEVSTAVAMPSATDSAIEYAKENGIDLSKVIPTGADGQITLHDVRRYDR